MGTLESVEDEIAESGIGHRIDAQNPMRLSRERRAFYRILFRHQDRIGVREREIVRCIAVMVLESMRMEFETEHFEVLEESPGIANARDGMDPPAVKMRSIDDVTGIQKIAEFATFEFHRDWIRT